MLKKKINKWLYNQAFNLLKRQAKVKLHNIEIEGYNIAYLESTHQAKKTLILIHGLNDEKETWLILASALKGKYKPQYMPNFMIEHMMEKRVAIAELDKKKFHYIVDGNMLHRDNLEEELKNIK